MSTNPSHSLSDEIVIKTPSLRPGIRLSAPKEPVAGVAAVASSSQHVFGLAGLKQGIEGMAKLNQMNGFDLEHRVFDIHPGESRLA